MEFRSTILLLFAVLWCGTILSHMTADSCLSEERLALLKVKAAHPTPKLSSWKGDDCCQWKGVRCDSHTSHIIRLDLHNSLADPYPLANNGALSPAVFSLTQLKYLDLSSNYLGGTMPAGLFGLKGLEHLDLSGNGFEGAIPIGIASLHNLTYLNLADAGFSGSIPPQLGSLTRLHFLDLSSGKMWSSSLAWMRNLSALNYLALDGVDLSQMRSENWGDSISYLHNLHSLHLSGCQLSGPIPIGLRNLTSLASLDLSDNDQISSAIPEWMGNLTSLERGPMPPASGQPGAGAAPGITERRGGIGSHAVFRSPAPEILETQGSFEYEEDAAELKSGSQSADNICCRASTEATQCHCPCPAPGMSTEAGCQPPAW